MISIVFVFICLHFNTTQNTIRTGSIQHTVPASMLEGCLCAVGEAFAKLYFLCKKNSYKSAVLFKSFHLGISTRLAVIEAPRVVGGYGD